MGLINRTFYTYLLSFGAILLFGFLGLLAVNYFFPVSLDAVETTCITSSGEAC